MVIDRCMDSRSLKTRIPVLRKAVKEKAAKGFEIVKVILQFY
jgi:hypothetical protein